LPLFGNPTKTSTGYFIVPTAPALRVNEDAGASIDSFGSIDKIKCVNKSSK